MELYAGFDLHSNNCHLGIVDQTGKRVMGKKLRNEPELILAQLEPFKTEMTEVTVESTYNWYWLVDLLMDHGYRTRLANPSAMQRYSGLKFSNDAHDAFWLAEMLRLGILPQGYIYPKEHRPVRDLLRKRGHLVRLRTSLILSLKNIVARNSGVSVSANDIKVCKQDRVSPLLPDEEHLQLCCRTSKESIDFFTRQIRELERAVEKSALQMTGYELLQTMPGVGKILSLTIYLETGDAGRFAGPGVNAVRSFILAFWLCKTLK
jgi:transposase